MRLLKLSANQPTFRTVTFNRTGLSLVLAEQKSEKAKRTETYNGVGKSLMFALIHYCLGSNKIQAFQSHLKGWVFTLEIELDGKTHTISRSADKSAEITLNGAKTTLAKLKAFLQEGTFDVPVGIPHLTFRSLISRFLRSGRSAYSEFKYSVAGEAMTPYEAMLRSACLLGLDLKLARDKYDLRKRETKLKDTMAQLESDPLFSKLLEAGAVDIELVALREEAQRLEQDLKAFRVAEDYAEIESKADAIKGRLSSLRRRVVKIEQALGQIDRSLVTKGDLSVELVTGLYKEAETALPDQVQAKIEDVLAFQEELKKKRVYRLTQERQRRARDLETAQAAVAEASKELDDAIRYLNDHRALDEYLAVNAEFNSVSTKIAKLEQSQALRESVDHELGQIAVSKAEGNLRTEEYLKSSAALIEEASKAFRGFSRVLYGSRPSGLTVKNDVGDDRPRYRIEAHIQSDAAEGINEAKIFCFDMTLLILQRGHRVKFLGHDSTLFHSVDPRQRLSMFEIADRVCAELDVQYIAALNLHDVTSIQEQVEVDAEEWAGLFEMPVVLRLTDASPKDKLLGIDVDMDYAS